MAGKTTEILSAEATIHLTALLDDQMRQTFPQVDGVNTTYKKYVSGHEDAPPFVSFMDRLSPELRAPVIDRALEAAADPEHPAFCEHGSAHTTFYEAIEKLRYFVSELQGEHRWGTLDVSDLLNIPTGGSDIGRTKQRFLVETPMFSRISVRPKPFLDASEIGHSTSAIGTLYKQLRRAGAVSVDHMASAILTANFLKLAPEESLTIFGNKEYRERLLGAKFPKAGLVSANNPDHVRMMHALYNTLTVPTTGGRVLNYDPEAYKRAVGILEVNNLVKPGAIHREPLRMVQTKDAAFARAVFASAEEKAHRLAPKELLDPVRTKYIEMHYGKHVTSELITAYVLIPRYM